jgi:hypothetical protein
MMLQKYEDLESFEFFASSQVITKYWPADAGTVISLPSGAKV